MFNYLRNASLMLFLLQSGCSAVRPIPLVATSLPAAASCLPTPVPELRVTGQASNAGTTPDNWYALRNMVFEKDFSSAEKLLASEPSLIRATNQIGETVLHFLAVENDLEGVAWLAAHGADLNTRNEFGTPVLFEVADLGYKDLFTRLVTSGADLQAKDEYKQEIFTHLRDSDRADMADWIAKQKFPIP